MSDSMAVLLRIQALTKGGIRHEDIPELRRLANQHYSENAMRDLIEPLFSALQKKRRIRTDE